MESKLCDVKFNWRFSLESLGLEYIKEQVIIPAFLNSGEHQLREQELVKILRKKDKEIDDYKMQGVKLTRSNWFSAYLQIIHKKKTKKKLAY
jgi:hypothetical protein